MSEPPSLLASCGSELCDAACGAESDERTFSGGFSQLRVTNCRVRKTVESQLVEYSRSMVDNERAACVNFQTSLASLHCGN